MIDNGRHVWRILCSFSKYVTVNVMFYFNNLYKFLISHDFFLMYKIQKVIYEWECVSNKKKAIRVTFHDMFILADRGRNLYEMAAKGIEVFALCLTNYLATH